MRKIKLIMLFWLTSLPTKLCAADTLVYKGFVMTKLDRTIFANNNVVTVPYANQIGTTDFFVAIDTNSLDFYGRISTGIFITNEYSGGEIDINNFPIPKLKRSNSSVFSSDWGRMVNCLKTGNYWFKVNHKSNIQFFILECEFKYIPYKQIEFATANIYSKNKKQVSTKYNVMCYFITEFIKFIPVKITSCPRIAQKCNEYYK